MLKRTKSHKLSYAEGCGPLPMYVYHLGMSADKGMKQTASGVINGKSIRSVGNRRAPRSYTSRIAV